MFVLKNLLFLHKILLLLLYAISMSSAATTMESATTTIVKNQETNSIEGGKDVEEIIISHDGFGNEKIFIVNNDTKTQLTMPNAGPLHCYTCDDCGVSTNATLKKCGNDENACVVSICY